MKRFVKIFFIHRVLCPVCGVSLRSETLKNHHDRVHLKKKNFICDACGFAFFLKANLKVIKENIHINPISKNCTSSRTT